jgi:hypothetical protein
MDAQHDTVDRTDRRQCFDQTAEQQAIDRHTVAVDIPEALRKAIVTATRSGTTHHSLACETGIDADTITRFVCGKCKISLPTAAVIADVLGLKLVLKAK